MSGSTGSGPAGSQGTFVESRHRRVALSPQNKSRNANYYDDECLHWLSSSLDGIELRKSFFQTFDSVSPLGGFRRAGGVLVPKQANFVNRVFERNSLGPFDGNEVFHLLGIIHEATMLFRAAQPLGCQLLLAVDHDPEVRRRFSRSFDATDAYESIAGSLYPNSIILLKQIQRVRIPRSAARTDETEFHRVVP
jgi:hypothetical protein